MLSTNFFLINNLHWFLLLIKEAHLVIRELPSSARKVPGPVATHLNKKRRKKKVATTNSALLLGYFVGCLVSSEYVGSDKHDDWDKNLSGWAGQASELGKVKTSRPYPFMCWAGRSKTWVAATHEAHRNTPTCLFWRFKLQTTVDVLYICQKYLH